MRVGGRRKGLDISARWGYVCGTCASFLLATCKVLSPHWLHYSRACPPSPRALSPSASPTSLGTGAMHVVFAFSLRLPETKSRGRTFPRRVQGPHVEDIHALHLSQNL